MEHSPTHSVEAICSPAYISLAIENFLGFHFASLEHNASSAERILPAQAAKIGIISETSKKNIKKSPKSCNFGE